MSIEQSQRAVRELESLMHRDPVAEAASAEFNRTFHKCRAELTAEQWHMVWNKAVQWAMANPPCRFCGSLPDAEDSEWCSNPRCGAVLSSPVQRIAPPTPYRCIKPQCPQDCDMCNHAIPGDDAALVLIADLLDGLAVDGFDAPLQDGESALVDRAREFLAEARSRPNAAAGTDFRATTDIRGHTVVEAKLPCINGLSAWVMVADLGKPQPEDEMFGGIDREGMGHRIASALGVLGMEPSGWVRLADSDWVNIVNAPSVLDPFKDQEEAVREAVKLTEAKLKLLNVGPWCCPNGRAAGVEVCKECAETSAAYQAAMSPRGVSRPQDETKET